MGVIIPREFVKEKYSISDMYFQIKLSVQIVWLIALTSRIITHFWHFHDLCQTMFTAINLRWQNHLLCENVTSNIIALGIFMGTN